jgi:hypothetical protein
MKTEIINSNHTTSEIDRELQTALDAFDTKQLYTICAIVRYMNKASNFFMTPEASARFTESMKPYISYAYFDEAMQIFKHKVIEYTSEDKKYYLQIAIILCKTSHYLLPIVNHLQDLYKNSIHS